jgi:DNA-binding transcriptional ArsR family regulator
MSAEKLFGSARRASQFLKALANENRLMLLYILVDGEYSVSELEEIRGLPQPILSQQLARLRKDDLVETRRDGKKIYYSLASAEAREILEVVYDGFVRQT